MAIDDLEHRIGMVRSPEIAERFGDRAHLGRGFFFLLDGALTGSVRSWLDYLVPDERREQSRVVPLFGEGGIDLPGVYLSQLTPPDLHLASLTSDRQLYRADEDAVELFVFHPFFEGDELELQVRMNDADFRSRTVELDDLGCADLALHDLPVGEYEVQFADAPDETPACTFTVAEYQLSGLVARVAAQDFDGDAMTVELELESYGQPVDGPVRVEWTSEGERLASMEVEATDGTCEVEVELDGEGPFALQLQLVDAPDRTATVPLTGTRKREREATTFGTLGVETRARLVPSEGARRVRGLYLTEGATRNSLFQLEDVAASPARLSALAGVEAATAVLFEANGERREIEIGPLERGDEIEIELESPAALLAIGAVSDDRAWEGWTTLVAPAEWSPDIDVENPEPGETGEVTVSLGDKTSRDDAPADVYLVVKDARLPGGDTPEQRLAGEIKTWGDDMSDFMETDYVETDFHEVGQILRNASNQPPYAPAEEVVYESAPAAEQDSPMPRAHASGGAEAATDEAPVPGRARRKGSGEAIDDVSAPAADPPPSDETEEAHSDDEPADVLFAGLLRAENGEASIEVEWPDACADITVEAFATDGSNWAQTEETLQIERSPFLDFELPSFVHGDDVVQATLTAQCDSGRMSIEVERNGEPVDLQRGDEDVDGPVESERVRLSFPARTGDYQAIVRDLETDAYFERRQRVEPPGRLRSLARGVRFLESGDTLSTDGDILSLRPLPGLGEPFERLCDATTNYQHLCCEQTAAKILSSCAAYLSADEPKRRTRAADAIESGVERERDMWLEGRGFKLYPHSSDRPNTRWGKIATRYLQWVGLLDDRDLPTSLQSSVQLADRMVEDAADAYGIDVPPRDFDTCREGYAAVRFGEDESDERALELARGRLDGDGIERKPAPSSPLSGALGRRTESAYAAAILLHAGTPADVEPALRAADRVTSEIGPDDRLYSTTDSVAAIAMMTELQSIGLGSGDTRLAVDGTETTLDAVIDDDPDPMSLECLEGRAAVEVTRIVEEDWDELEDRVPVETRFERDGDEVSTLAPGDPVEFVVELTDGYQPGDLLRVCLPDALTRLEGGGQVDAFTVDFAGDDTARVPLVATSATLDETGTPTDQHFAICIRNMFDEARTGSPDPVAVRV